MNSVEIRRGGKNNTIHTLSVFNRNKTICLALERFANLKACPFSCLHAARLPARSHCAGGFPFPSPQTSHDPRKLPAPSPRCSLAMQHAASIQLGGSSWDQPVLLGCAGVENSNEPKDERRDPAGKGSLQALQENLLSLPLEKAKFKPPMR